MSKSKASSATDYVDLQVRQDSGDTLKVQGSGIATNREYGVAEIVTAISENGIGNWISTLPATRPSLAGGSQLYVPAQASIRGEFVHFQVEGHPFNGNGARDYGAVFNIPISQAPSLANFISSNSIGSAPTYTADTEEENWDGEDWDEDDTYAPDEAGNCKCGSCSPKSEGVTSTFGVPTVTAADNYAVINGVKFILVQE